MHILHKLERVYRVLNLATGNYEYTKAPSPEGALLNIHVDQGIAIPDEQVWLDHYTMSLGNYAIEYNARGE